MNLYIAIFINYKVIYICIIICINCKVNFKFFYLTDIKKRVYINVYDNGSFITK